MARQLPVYTSPALYDALKEEGYNLPPECGDVKLTMPVDGLMELHYIVFLRPADLERIGRALLRIAAEQKRDG